MKNQELQRRQNKIQTISLTFIQGYLKIQLVLSLVNLSNQGEEGNMEQKTYIPKIQEIQRKWYLINAEGLTLGRLASKIATLLMGKHKNNYTPFFDTGDFVVVINAEKIKVTGKKLEQKLYRHHTGYPGHLKEERLMDLLARKPEEVSRRAVWGMLPHNRLGRRLIRKLKVYAGSQHPHQAQQPIPIAIEE